MSMRLTLGTTLAGLPISEFNLVFLKPDFEILTFFQCTWFFLIMKTARFQLFFSQKSFALAKHCLSYIFIINLLWWKG